MNGNMQHHKKHTTICSRQLTVPLLPFFVGDTMRKLGEQLLKRWRKVRREIYGKLVLASSYMSGHPTSMKHELHVTIMGIRKKKYPNE